ncbi:MAG: AarF/UbiB family protein, partial [Gaiellaceae bacterium]
MHRAVLLDGRRVAVKVQRPGIAEEVERDLALLAFLARRLERRRPEALAFHPPTPSRSTRVANSTSGSRRGPPS